MSVGSHARDNRSDILWEHTSPAGPELGRFVEGGRTDVAVIGGGVAGLSTAYHLARAGVEVTLLEATEPGGGATGRSGGLIAPDLIRQTPAEVEAGMGEGRGERLVRMIGGSARFCFDLIDELGLDCEASRNGFWTPGHNDTVANRLLQRVREWQGRGFEVRWADADETTDRLGVDRYLGAMVFADGGTVNPLAFSRGLAAAARRHGARLYSQSPVIGLKHNGTKWLVRTSAGQLEASRLVLAANGGNAGLHERLRGTALPLDVIEYATRPLTPDEQSHVLKGDASFTDKQTYVFTARFDADRRLIAAFPDFALPRRRSTLLAEARRRVELHFPVLKGIGIQYLWAGRAWLNPDLLPRIYDLGDDACAVQACNGRGIATNTLLGAELAAALEANDFSRLSLRAEPPRPVRAYPLTRLVPSFLMMLAHVRSHLSRCLKR